MGAYIEDLNKLSSGSIDIKKANKSLIGEVTERLGRRSEHGIPVIDSEEMRGMELKLLCAILLTMTANL